MVFNKEQITRMICLVRCMIYQVDKAMYQNPLNHALFIIPSVAHIGSSCNKTLLNPCSRLLLTLRLPGRSWEGSSGSCYASPFFVSAAFFVVVFVAVISTAVLLPLLFHLFGPRSVSTSIQWRQRSQTI